MWFTRLSHRLSSLSSVCEGPSAACLRAQVYTFIMQELVKYRGMYTSMAELLKSGTPGPDLHAHHDLLASALPQGSGGQVLSQHLLLE